MAAVKHRYFLATNGNTLDYLTYDFSLRHSRGFWQKPPGLSHLRPLDSEPKSQAGVTNWSAYAKTSARITHIESQTHMQTKQSERREIAIDRNEYA